MTSLAANLHRSLPCFKFFVSLFRGLPASLAKLSASSKSCSQAFLPAKIKKKTESAALLLSPLFSVTCDTINATGKAPLIPLLTLGTTSPVTILLLLQTWWMSLGHTAASLWFSLSGLPPQLQTHFLFPNLTSSHRFSLGLRL